MHELSIAQSVVELVSEQLSEGQRVSLVRLRIGALSSVHQDALNFSYELITEGTPLEKSQLEIQMVPVKVYCTQCQSEVELPGIQKFACPVCQTPSGDIRQGRELDLESFQLAAESPV